jgi:hypothetical protein
VEDPTNTDDGTPITDPPEPEDAAELARETLRAVRRMGRNVDLIKGQSEGHGKRLSAMEARLDTVERQIVAGVHESLPSYEVAFPPIEPATPTHAVRPPAQSVTNEVIRSGRESLRVAAMNAVEAAAETKAQTPILERVDEKTERVIAQNERIAAENARQTSMLEGIGASFNETSQKLIGQVLGTAFAVFLALVGAAFVKDCKAAASRLPPVDVPTLGAVPTDGHEG